MYSNVLQWRQIRKKILVDGKSILSTSKDTGISRNTIRKILKQRFPLDMADEKHRMRKSILQLKLKNFLRLN